MKHRLALYEWLLLIFCLCAFALLLFAVGEARAQVPASKNGQFAFSTSGTNQYMRFTAQVKLTTDDDFIAWDSWCESFSSFGPGSYFWWIGNPGTGLPLANSAEGWVVTWQECGTDDTCTTGCGPLALGAVRRVRGDRLTDSTLDGLVNTPDFIRHSIDSGKASPSQYICDGDGSGVTFNP